MTQQEIHDRMQELNEALIASQRDTAKRERARQAAERKAMQAECADKGHIFVRTGMYGIGRSCGICGANEIKPTEVANHNLTRVA